MRPEPDFNRLTSQAIAQYDNANYSSGLVSFVMRRGHQLLDKSSVSDDTTRIIEVGAGSGAHLSHVTRPFGKYVLTDGSDEMLAHARRKHQGRPNIEFKKENAAKLSFPDASFDRLIATHVLEHMPEPHNVLREWNRVVKPGGTISIVLPTDPGFAWRFGRNFGPRATSQANGLPYDYIMAREHINPIFNLVALLNFYFDSKYCIWWPFRLPFADINLLYIAHIRTS